MSPLSSRSLWARRWLHFDSMAIHINLLAESQALEEMRRRDPVKRAIWVGAIVGALVLAWSGYLQAKAMVMRGEVTRLEAQTKARETAYKQIREHEKKLEEANNKLMSLQRLATNRFLNGTVLDALQHTTVDDVQLMHLKIANDYEPIAEIKAKTNAILESTENPAQTLDYSYEKQLDLLKKVQRGIVDEVTSKHRVLVYANKTVVFG